jgi:hypothetical protein
LIIRSLILTVALGPYLYYGTKDTLFHFRGRRVTLVEHLLHVGVAVAIVAAIASAYRGRTGAMIVGLLLFLLVGRDRRVRLPPQLARARNGPAREGATWRF